MPDGFNEAILLMEGTLEDPYQRYRVIGVERRHIMTVFEAKANLTWSWFHGERDLNHHRIFRTAPLASASASAPAEAPEAPLYDELEVQVPLVGLPQGQSGPKARSGRA